MSRYIKIEPKTKGIWVLSVDTLLEIVEEFKHSTRFLKTSINQFFIKDHLTST